MDTNTTAQALERAFARDIEDGTLEVRSGEGAVVVDGGNWQISVPVSGPVGLDLPMNDPNYYEEDTDAFIENVLALPAEESLAVADQELNGALSSGLREAGDVWSIRLGERLAKVGV